MNFAMRIELIVFVAILLAFIASGVYLRRRLRDYDGMGEVKRKAPHRYRPPDKSL